MLPPPTPSLEVRAGGLMSLNSVVALMCAAAASMSSSLSTSAALHSLIGAPGQRCCTILIVPNDGIFRSTAAGAGGPDARALEAGRTRTVGRVVAAQQDPLCSAT